MVGLLPICADHGHRALAARTRAPSHEALAERMERMPDLRDSIHPTGKGHLGYGERGISAVVNPERLRRILTRMLDEKEFLSPTGFGRSLATTKSIPSWSIVGGQEYRVTICRQNRIPGMFGGNSNWRGPIWMPVNALIIRALMTYYLYYGDSFKIECPTGSGHLMNLFEVGRRDRESPDENLPAR